MIEARTTLIVREATAADGAATRRLIQRAMSEYRTADPLMHEGYVAYSLDAAHALGAVQLVAELDGELVGSVLFSPRVLLRAGWPDSVSTFGTLVVEPSIRQRGIGATLVAACLDRARASGATGAIIETMPFMTTGAAFYGRAGFTRWEPGDWDGTQILASFLAGKPAPRTILSAWRLDFD